VVLEGAAAWEDVTSFLGNAASRIERLTALSNLASEIARSRYAPGLHPWTSMHDLCLSQVASPTRHQFPHLRISALSGDALEFRYIDTAIRSNQWHRQATPAEAFSRLESFFSQLNWFGSHLASRTPNQRLERP
jgi:hypothetical protein